MLLVMIAGMISLPPTSSAGDIYKWVDASGVTHYSQEKPETIASLEVIETQDRYTPPPPDSTEALNRIQRLTRQLAEERLALEQQRRDRERLALDRARLRQQQLEEQRWNRQRNYLDYGYVVPGGYGLAHYPGYLARGHRSNSYRYGHGHGGVSFGFANRRGDTAAILKFGYGDGYGYDHPYGKRHRHGDKLHHRDKSGFKSNRRYDRNRVSRPPGAIRNRGLVHPQPTTRAVGTGRPSRLARWH
jgi:hypothetical protein